MYFLIRRLIHMQLFTAKDYRVEAFGKVQSFALPFTDARQTGDVVDYLRQVYKYISLPIETPMVMALDEDCSDLAHNGAQGSETMRWVEFSNALNLRHYVKCLLDVGFGLGFSSLTLSKESQSSFL